jgi:hypothetical protein
VAVSDAELRRKRAVDNPATEGIEPHTVMMKAKSNDWRKAIVFPDSVQK